MTMAADSEFETFFSQCGITAPVEFTEQCHALYLLLSEANKNVNLTRIESAPDYWSRHIADSISIAKFFPYLVDAPYQIADIGCGAGFPSLPLAAAFPKLQLTAIDSIGKKTHFVQSAAVQLNLSNLRTVTGRSKELSCQAEWQNHFDIITARAVADARTIFRENRRLLKPGGQFILYKTPEQINGELDDLCKASAAYGFSWATSAEFDLPGNSGKRCFLFSLTSS
jgi:16S rRNA (guanine527-N7)-methyltransferase